jgi:hypothetical protein
MPDSSVEAPGNERSPAFPVRPYRLRSFGKGQRSRFRRKIWLELLAELGTTEPSEPQRRLMARICDLEVQVAVSHARLEKGELGASGLRLLTAVDRSRRSLRRELFAPRPAPSREPEGAMQVPALEPEPKPEQNAPAHSLADALAAGKEEAPS